MRSSRRDALAKLRAQIVANRPLIGAGAGTGISAKFCEKGGVDLLIIYNSGRFRMAGRGSLAGMLPYGDANAILLDMAREVLPVVSVTPVLAGVCGTDPFRIMDHFLDEIKRLGFAGVQNFPTVGLFDGRFRMNLEETGMGYDLEVDMVRLAREKDLLTAPYVFNPEEAVAMTRAGADIIVAHMGLTTKGSIGASSALRLEDCVKVIQEITDEVRRIREEVIVLCHGGPISEPADAEFIIQNVRGVNGFFGASSIERLATEASITEQARKFKSIRFEPSSGSRGSKSSRAKPPRRPSGKKR